MGRTQLLLGEKSQWTKLETPFYISLEETLFSGQIFNFYKMGRTGALSPLVAPNAQIYCGVISESCFIFQQSDRDIYYFTDASDPPAVLCRFFNLDVTADVPFSVPGLRFLTNDVVPTIFAFICSANNNISRIDRMVKRLYALGECKWRVFLNDDVVTICGDSERADSDGVGDERVDLHSFPEIKSLIEKEAYFRTNGFGYRANFICSTAKTLHSGDIPDESMSYEDARKMLMSLKGVGRKVADCICLISLRKFTVVPIDTHIFRFSRKTFNFTMERLSDRSYGEIQRMWIERYGKYAGVVQLHVFKRGIDKAI